MATHYWDPSCSEKSCFLSSYLNKSYFKKFYSLSLQDKNVERNCWRAAAICYNTSRHGFLWRVATQTDPSTMIVAAENSILPAAAYCQHYQGFPVTESCNTDPVCCNCSSRKSVFLVISSFTTTVQNNGFLYTFLNISEPKMYYIYFEETLNMDYKVLHYIQQSQVKHWWKRALQFLTGGNHFHQ